MRIQQHLNKAICHFEGGFGTAVMNAEGTSWTFTCVTIRFTERGEVDMLKGKDQVYAMLIKEHGLEYGFRKARRGWSSPHQPEEGVYS